MLASDDGLVRSFDEILRNALDKGKALKPPGSLNPALQIHNLKAELAASEDIWRRTGIRAQAALEAAARNLFYDLLATLPIESAAFGQVWTILDTVAIFSDSGYCEPALPLYLVEELLDSQTLEACRLVFDYLDSRRERLIKKFFAQRNLIILRACNDLLRRLSRADDTVFCGRVFVFLFQTFPLGDRSSVNLRGEFHVDNVTTYKKLDRGTTAHDPMHIDEPVPTGAPVEEQKDTSEPLEEIETGASHVDSTRKSVKFEEKNETALLSTDIDMDVLYEKFWSLQEWFSQPTKLFDDADFQEYKDSLRITLDKFKDIQQQQSAHGTAKLPMESNRGLKRKRPDQEEQLEYNFNPKYLTSRDLFDLEVSDLSFRRHILVQALIVIEFLLGLTPKAKKNLEGLQNKSVQYSYVLTDENAQWASNTRNEIASYLQQGPEGKFYYRMVDTVLSREKHWVHWKAENCTGMRRAPVAPSGFADAENVVQKLATARKLRPTVLGALDLSFLTGDEGQDGMSKFRDSARFKPPRIESFKGPIMDDDFDIERTEDADEKRAAQERRASKLWRTLRIASRGRLNVFDQIDDGSNLKPLFEPDVAEVKLQADSNGLESETSDKDGASHKLKPPLSPLSQAGQPEVLVTEPHTSVIATRAPASMAQESQPTLRWSTQLNVSDPRKTSSLKGDRITLPQSSLSELLAAATVITSEDVRPQNSFFDPFNPHSFAAERRATEQIYERQQNLPQPLTFRLVNPVNGHVIYAGIREFSSPDEFIGLSDYLRRALGIPELQVDDDVPGRLTVHYEKIPKGQFVKFRPLEAGYDVDDWKAFLEQHLRDTYVTLTRGEEIALSVGRETYRFLVDEIKPNAGAVSLIDTDLEVDIEPLSEEQARETLQKLAKKTHVNGGTGAAQSPGGRITLDVDELGQVGASQYVDYTLEKWDRLADLHIELTNLDSDMDLDVFVTALTPRLRSKPRQDYYTSANFSSESTKSIHIGKSNADMENAEALLISVRAWTDENAEQSTLASFRLSVSSSIYAEDLSDQTRGDAPGPDEERCGNCLQLVPKRTMFLHQNFCLRNNILCPQCRNVFQKTSSEWNNHWHCEHDEAHGISAASKVKHYTLLHTAQICDICDYRANNVPDLAFHKTTTCPGKLVLCQFCHLQVPQQGPEDPNFESAEVLLSGLTPHEITDGGRTTECHLCTRIIRLRDMASHLKHHDLQRLTRSTPRICTNVNCGRTIDLVSRSADVTHRSPNDIGLCDACFGPLYISQYDPEGKALRRRVERRYLTQLLTGCKQPWCRNSLCKSGLAHTHAGEDRTMTSKEASAVIKPLVDGLKSVDVPAQFCTDEASQSRRALAELLSAEGGPPDPSGKGKGKAASSDNKGYALEWCIAALDIEGGNLDKARAWLQGFAPRRDEVAN